MTTFLDPSAGRSGRAPAREEAQRDEIFREFERTIKILAHQLATRLPPHMDIGDLESAGAIGLMDAMTKFDPLRGVKLKTYAVIRIRGAMMDEIAAAALDSRLRVEGFLCAKSARSKKLVLHITKVAFGQGD